MLVDSGRVQCSETSDCTSRGEAFANSVCMDSICVEEPRWSCVGDEPPEAAGPGPFAVTMLLRNVIDSTPLAGVEVRLCRKLDITCEQSVVPEVMSDENGLVTFSVQSGFEGYAYLVRSDLTPGLYFFSGPVSRDLPEIQVSMGSPQVNALLALQVGASQAPERGLMLLDSRDCTGAPASEISFTPTEINAEAVRFYAEQNLPSGSATHTDSSGYGGFLNVSPGTITIVATLANTGRTVGEVTVLVREGSMTYGSIQPNGG